MTLIERGTKQYDLGRTLDVVDGINTKDCAVSIFGRLLASYLRMENIERAALNWNCEEVKHLCESTRKDLELASEELQKLFTERNEE